jgi:hypothetical protein
MPTPAVGDYLIHLSAANPGQQNVAGSNEPFRGRATRIRMLLDMGLPELR